MQSPSGVRQEVAAMYEKHGHVVLRRARRILGDEHEAQDVLHEIFASLLQKPDSFAGQSSVTTFLYAATTHRCLNRIRDAKTRNRLLHLERREEGVGARDGVVAARQLLARLPDDLAQAVVYYHLDEMTHEEIAEQMGCSRRTVGNLLERAAAHFREEATS
jgi:RNA polymerase sigma-70 factor (ECF subfamily)